MLQKVPSEVALFACTFHQTKAQREKFFRSEIFLFSERFEKWISRIAIEIDQQIHTVMLAMTGDLDAFVTLDIVDGQGYALACLEVAHASRTDLSTRLVLVCR